MKTKRELEVMAHEVYRLASEKLNADKKSKKPEPGDAMLYAMQSNENRRWYDKMLDKIAELPE